jgi:hypothetical protein
MKRHLLIVTLIISLQLSIQQISYETLKKKAVKLTEDDLKLEDDASEKIEEKLVAPTIVGGYWCDKDIKLNTVRQEVMTNNNYNKYIELTLGYFIDINISFYILQPRGVTIVANMRRNYSKLSRLY